MYQHQEMRNGRHGRQEIAEVCSKGNHLMNILVYGAGVIGSVYAARLQEAGYHVTLLARDQHED
jgi:lactate dehydrogenase-like 2-hydroxyacid dehydrogenase